ncbi:MAG: T9SS type A sorting domain-containing protein [Cryomorphaceae bacterium]|nr:T9SS type A sorting domain-containing protein [Cryomorphaceae bacterium]
MKTTKILTTIVLVVLGLFASNAQFTVTTSPPLTANNGQSGVTFELSTSASIIVTEIANTFNTGVQSADIWYRIGGVQHATGVAPNITAANGWVQLVTGQAVTGNNTTPVPIPGNYSLTIPANTDVGFFIGGGMRYQTHAGTPDQFSDATITIKTGTNYGYGGGAPSPTFHPRQFLGSVTYIFSGPCTDPPIAGFTAASETEVCIGNTTDLSLDSATFGLGQTYQWQVSLDGTTWMNLPGDTTASTTVSINDTTFYRAIVFCGNGSDTSLPIQVNAVGAPLSGTYTINQNAPAGGTNFQSFQDFFDALECGGVGGPVTVNVVTGTGPYNEHVIAPEVSNVSAINTITINGNGNTLAHSGGINDRATLTFDGTDWITIDNLKIEATGATYGWTLHLTNNADHNTFTNCEFLSSTTSTSSLFSNIVMSNSPTSPTIAGPSGSYNHFENNLIEGGYYAVTINGASAADMEVGNTFINNELADWRYYGFYVRAQDSLVLSGNDIHRENRADHTFHRAFQFFTGLTNARIMGNKIRDFHTGTGGSTNTSTNYVIYMSSANGSANAPNIIANNLIYNMDNQGGFYGIYNFNSSNWYVYHNTFALDFSTSATNLTQVFYHTSTGNDLEFKNNLIYVDRPGTGQIHGVYLNNASANIDIEGNAYYFPDLSSSNVHIGYSGSNQSDLSDWQSVNSGAFDQNAVHVDPFFVGLSIDSLRPQNSAIKFIGDNVLTYVDEDFDGTPRPSSPDPGAYQFEPPQGADMAIMSYQSPSAGCPGTEDVIIRVNNLASDTVETIRVIWSINNVAQTPVVVTDSFYPGNMIDINLGTFTVSGTGMYDIEATIDSIYPGVDLDITNNSMDLMGYRAGLSGTFTINQLSAPSATNFTSFEEFAEALNDFGVCGAVVANVAPGSGPYNEQIEFQEVNGASATNTITLNGNGNTLSYSASGTADRTTLAINGTDYLTIDSLRVEANGASFGWVMTVSNDANHNTFKNCHFETDDNSTSLNFSNVVMSGSPTSGTLGGDIGNYNTFENNVHIGGYYGITMSGVSSAQRNVGNKVINSTFEDFYFYGMYLRSQDSLVIDGNDISRGGRTTLSTFYGIFLTQGNAGCQVINNRIHDNSTQNTTTTNAAYPLYMSSATATAASPSIFANNLFYNINNGGTIYLLYILGALNDHWKFYHNTVILDQPNASSSSATRLMYFSGAQNNFEVKNNIFYLDRSSAPGYYIHMLNAGASIDYDNNVFHTPDPSAMTFGYHGSDITDFADWQSNGFDPNGLEADPVFVGGTGNDAYRPTVGAVKGVGANVLGDVPTDIEGVARTTTPDPGVFQFDPLPCSGAYDITIDTLFPGGSALSWTSVAPVNEWQVEWDVCGFTPGSGFGNLDSVVTSSSNYQLPNLPMGECVCVFIREKCPSGGYSDWSQPIEICVPIEDDAEMVSIISPEDMQCGDSTMQVIVEIRNNGFNPITSMPITVNLSGDYNQIINFTYTGNLLENEVDTVVVGTFNSYWGGWVSVEAFTSLPGDQLTSNDTLRLDSMVVIPFQPDAEDAFFCPGTDSMYVKGRSFPNLIYNWYDVATGGTPFHIGDSINVPTAGGLTYYLAYSDLKDSLASTATGNVQTGNGGNMFDLDIFTSLSITGFTMYGASIGMTDVAVYYKVGSLQGHENNSGSWTLVETVQNVNLQGAATPVKFNLSTPLFLAAGQEYGIYIQPITGNISYASGNPLGSSLGSNADLEILTGVTKAGLFGSTLSPRSWKGLVHYGSESCSDIRTPVSPTPASDSIVASFDFDEVSHTVNFYNTSHNADSVNWFIDTLTFNTDTVSYQFPRTDSFEVCLVAYGLCGNDTTCQWVWAENVSVNTHGLAASLKVFPNPNQGVFTLTFEQNTVDDVTIQLLDLSGKVVWMEHKKTFSGTYSKTFDRGDLASGAYMLRINNRDGIITRRVVIGK